jgi:hypothetical protein
VAAARETVLLTVPSSQTLHPNTLQHSTDVQPGVATVLISHAEVARRGNTTMAAVMRAVPPAFRYPVVVADFTRREKCVGV